MSRNKDIKYLHKITGLSYKECRTLMKENHWDWWRAWLSSKGSCYKPLLGVMDAVSDVSNALAKAINEFGEAVTKTFNEVISNV